MSSQAAASDPLGLPGFTFADLHRPARLRELYDRFTAEVAGTEPALWQQWTQYRELPDSLSPISRGNLIVQMAPHVSRFVARLFNVEGESTALYIQQQIGDRKVKVTRLARGLPVGVPETRSGCHGIVQAPEPAQARRPRGHRVRQ